MNRKYEWITYGAGVTYMKKGYYKAAEQKFQEILYTNSDHENSYIQLGIVKKRQGRQDEAKNYFETALLKNPENEFSKCELGLLHLQNDNLMDAANTFSSVLRKNSSNVEALVNLGLVFGKQGDFDKAKKLIGDAYCKNKHLKDCFAKLGWLKAEELDWSGALEIMEQDQRSCRLSSSFQIHLAFALAHCGDFKKAESLVERAYRKKDSLRDGYARIAWIKVVGPVKDFVWAESFMERDLRAKRISPTWKIRMASLKSILGNLQMAERLVEEAYAEDEEVSDGYGRLGWFRHLTGENAKILKTMIEKDVRLNRFQTLGKLLQAVYMAITGSIEQSIKFVQLVVGENQEVKDYLSLIGWICLEAGSSRTCCDLMTLDFKKNRMSPSWYPSYAVVLNSQGQFAAAKEILELVLKYKKDSDMLYVGISLKPAALMSAIQFRQFIEQEFGINKLPYFQ
jgi:tetratricopeptide (TPR) repeat protein